MTEKRNTLVLLDGSSYLFRAYHALPPLMTAKGQPTGAMYGVVNMLRRLLNDEKPTYMAAVFDTKEKTFRHEKYEAYKANRPPMPDDLSSQIKPLYDLIQAMGIPLLAIPGYEADDIIGTLAEQAQEQNLRVVISTGDKDLAQLVTPHINLVNTMTGSVLNETTVLEKFGVTPAQIIDYLALMGDPIDNVPGIPKVGPKTAAKWLNAYQSIENIVQCAHEFKGKIGENLRAHLENLPLSKELVTICKTVALDIKPKDLTLKPQNEEKLRELFVEYEFKTWLKDLDNKAEIVKPQGVEYHSTFTVDVLKDLIKKIQKQKIFSFSIFTTTPSPLNSSMVGIAIALKAFEAFYIPIHHIQSPQTQLDKNQILQLLRPIFEDNTIQKIGHNLKFDLEILHYEGINVEGYLLDTMLESYVLNSTAIRHDYNTMAQHYLHYKTIAYEEVAGKGAKQVSFAAITVQQACFYACEKVDMVWQLHALLWDRLGSEPDLLSVYQTIEEPLIRVLKSMETIGVKIDPKLLGLQGLVLSKRLLELEDKAYSVAGESFNLGSPKQLQAILYEKLKLPVLEKTPGGQASTAESVLQDLSQEFDLPKIILEHRSLSKLKSTYIDRLPKEIHPITQRVHTSYQQAITTTGRLSSSEPNLQNIPMRTEEGQKIRQAFIADNDNYILSADYSQIELRIMAHLSQDKGLCKAFAEGQDIHQFTASEMFKIPFDQVTLMQRRAAKAINFGLIYGMSAFGLAKQLNTSRQEAQDYMQTYFLRYPGVQTYMENTRIQARQMGYVKTLFGRRLYLADINTQNIPKRRAAERAAINAPMQGTAADIIKKAMIAIDNWIRDQQLAIKMIMQVHDELVFEISENLLELASYKIKEYMEAATSLCVPLEVSVGYGKNWQEAH